MRSARNWMLESIVRTRFWPGSGSLSVDPSTRRRASRAVYMRPGTPCIAGGAGNFTHDLWYTYTATCTGNLTIDTCATMPVEKKLFSRSKVRSTS